MTRPHLRPHTGYDRSTEPLSRPTTDLLPEIFATLFADADKYREQGSRAEQELKRLAEPARDTEAKQADDQAAAAAVRDGNPAPARIHEAQLVTDREQAIRNMAAYPGIIADTTNAIHEARAELREHPDHGKETAKIKAKLKTDLEKAQATYQAFLESEARDAWIETATPMRPLRNLVNPADIVHDLERGYITDQTAGTTVLANLHTALTREN
ncbi:hypothetical protein [Arthrobacter sp. CJ23]|uniref:hypothetical protein n=1 Tax=Arthrobacter sp. CJ23 TaxID=2972479 RepID=UPI00215C9CA4|nr:hypothetical protein [Arthrobacter sp. CJ23]UVJ40245.1 hypothetical protein NVV90_03395 [Arthrobacter sp. CJ23]